MSSDRMAFLESERRRLLAEEPASDTARLFWRMSLDIIEEELAELRARNSRNSW